MAYRGDRYSGFQTQKNANSVQDEVTKALKTFYRKDFYLTCSSRTDTGVHAYQNYFHFDSDREIENTFLNIYHLNSLLPPDIVLKKFFKVKDDLHCRFDAISREYCYFIYQQKNPFVRETAFFYPYKINLDKLNEAASLLMKCGDFSSFSKKKTQVKNFICHLSKSEWREEGHLIVYNVISNRFLRGMVKGLSGTMLKVGRGIITIEEFQKIIEMKDQSKADFSVPSHGLFLMKVEFGNL